MILRASVSYPAKRDERETDSLLPVASVCRVHRRRNSSARGFRLSLTLHARFAGAEERLRARRIVGRRLQWTRRGGERIARRRGTCARPIAARLHGAVRFDQRSEVARPRRLATNATERRSGRSTAHSAAGERGRSRRRCCARVSSGALWEVWNVWSARVVTAGAPPRA